MGLPERDIAQAEGFIAPPGYRRHRPETTLLYQIVAEHYPRFRDRRVAEERPLPRYVEDEFEAYLECGLLDHGFLRVTCESLPFALRYLLATRPEVVTQVLGIVYRVISGYLIRKAGLTRASAVKGA